jgi:predicted O-methyltransferase YrrM
MRSLFRRTPIQVAAPTPSEAADAGTIAGRAGLRCFPKLQRHEDHPKAWTFPTYLDATQPWVRTLKELYAMPLAFPASLSPPMGLFLHALVRNVRPRCVIEIGTFLGVSTLWMASALEAASDDPPHLPLAAGKLHGTIHCFDDFGPIAPGPWRDASMSDRPRDEMVRDHLTRASLSHRVTLHKGDSARSVAAASRSLASESVDLAFIDGDHSGPGAVRDFHAVEPLLATGGYIVLHDTFPEQCGDHDGPRRIINEMNSLGRGRYECCEIYTAPLNYGMAVLRRLA